MGRPFTCRKCGAAGKMLGRGSIQKLCDECRASHAWCPRCSSAKPRESFHVAVRNANGLYGWCRPCQNLKVQLRKYRMSAAELEVMLERQGFACAICFEAFLGAPSIDHSHTTGEVRGLLCSGCNTGIGLLKEDPARFLSAMMYLERSQEAA